MAISLSTAKLVAPVPLSCAGSQKMAASLSTAKLDTPVSLSCTAARLLPATTTRFGHCLPTTALFLRIHPRRSAYAPHFFASLVSAPVTTASISIGDKLPEAALSYFGFDDELTTVTVSKLMKGKKAVLFVIPGAFTPICSQKHLARFVEKSRELCTKGVDFTYALGMELDLRNKSVGLGVRSRRYALLEEGIVKMLNLEEGDTFTFSGVEDILKVI